MPRVLRKPLVLIVALCLASVSAFAQSYHTPEQGSETRQDILDAIRPLAEWSYGAPVEFLVGDIRVSGNVAFVTVRAQRPGGEAIDIFKTPAALRHETDPQAGNGPTLEALLQKSGRAWVTVRYGINSSEGWWYDPIYCPIWAPVLPDICK